MTDTTREMTGNTGQCAGQSNETTREVGSADRDTGGGICQATIITNKYGIIGKVYTVNDGVVATAPGAGAMSDGSYEVVTVANLAQWNARLNVLTANAGIVTGVPRAEYGLSGRIMGRKDLEFLQPGAREGIITRSLDHLHWREGAPTLLCIDADRAEGCMSCRELDAVTRECVPELGDTRVLWRSSGSSLLRVRGVEGWARPFKAHGWIIISNGGYTRAVCECIRDRLAARGVVVDVSVASPEHWVFGQPATYAKGIIVPPRDVIMTGSVDVFDVHLLVAEVKQPVVVAEVEQPVQVTLSDSERRRYEAILRLKMADVEAFASAPEGERHNAQNGLVVKLAPFVREGLMGEAELRALVEDAAIRNGYLADVGASKWEAEFDKSLREGMDLLELQPLRPEAAPAQVFGAPGVVMGGEVSSAAMSAVVTAAVAPADNAATVRNWHARVCAGERSMPDWEALGTPEGAEAFDGLAWAGLKEFRRQVDAERKRLHKAAKRAEFANSADGIVQYMNEKYAFICDRGGKSFVMWTNDEGETKFKTVHDFKDMECKHNLIIDDKKVSYAKLWLEHPQRREYDGVVFDPTGKRSNSYYNMWQGFAIKPVKGDCRLIVNHIYNILAGGDADIYKFIMNCFAHVVQYPGVPLEVCLAFRGKPGCGKGVILRMIKNMFGKFGMHITNRKQLIGDFNAHLETCCFIFADEVCGNDDKKGEKQLMTLITEPTILIEPKGVNIFEVLNRITITMATNEDWVVPIAKDDRRYAVFDVPDTFVKDTKYFDALYECIEGDGASAFMEELQARDISGWRARSHIPDTAAKREQAELSLGPVDAWWLCILESGELPGRNATPGESKFATLLEDACKQADRRLQPRAFSKTLRSYGGEDMRLTSTSRAWRFPPLSACRAIWDSVHGARNWNDNEGWMTTFGRATLPALTIVSD